LFLLRPLKGAPAADLPVMISPWDQIEIIRVLPTTRVALNLKIREGASMALLWVKEGRFRRNALAATLAIMAAWPVEAQPPTADVLQQWQSLNAQAMEAHRSGQYVNGIKLAEEALALSRKAFGDRAPQTLTSLNNLAALYDSQGRYGEAEPLYQGALQARREVFGPRHPGTLQSLNNLAFLYEAEGRYGEAEPLYREALQARREVLGPRHPQTLTTLNNLAFLYVSQGRYGVSYR
jgi:tetratricopeptide (TPR) repeat protein